MRADSKHLVQLEMNVMRPVLEYFSCSKPGISHWPCVRPSYLIEPEFINDGDLNLHCDNRAVCILGME